MKNLFVAVLWLVSSAALAESEGERLIYTLGCVNCHHQTPKEIINAPPLIIVKTYSIEEFRHFLSTGITRSGRDLPAISSIMGIVAIEQFSHLTDDEIKLIYVFLNDGWTAERAAIEEAKIPVLYKAEFERMGLE